MSHTRPTQLMSKHVKSFSKCPSEGFPGTTYFGPWARLDGGRDNFQKMLLLAFRAPRVPDPAMGPGPLGLDLWTLRAFGLFCILSGILALK